MLVVDTQATRDALRFADLIPALRQMFQAQCEVPARHAHALNLDGKLVGSLILMPAWIPGGYLGIKTVCVFPGNAARGIPTLHATYMLSDAKTGVPLAQIDGNEITARRTAAASALAGSFLARKDAKTLLVVGAGRVASLLAEAYSACFRFERILAWNVHAEKAHLLVDRLRAGGFAAEVAADLEAAVKAADIVSCATLSTRPLVEGKWLRPGTHLDLIGGFTPEMRESDDECFRNSSVFVDNEEALIKAGDLLAPIREGVFAAKNLQATLGGLCRGLHPGRTHPGEITVFKSVGIALEDLAAASLVYERMRAPGSGAQPDRPAQES